MTKQGKTISSSNLTLRFYVRNGWTKEELDDCCTKGEVYMAHPDDIDPYYTLDPKQGSAFDIKKLLSLASEVVRAFDDRPWETDEEFCERFNWG